MRKFKVDILFYLLMVVTLQYSIKIQAEDLYVRVVEQLTGKDPANEAQVCGQDSLVYTTFQDRVLFFFGDTVLDNGTSRAKQNCAAIGAKIPARPNAMASTQDQDISRGINLNYYTSLGVAAAPLKSVSPEATVWFQNVVTIGNNIYATFYSVAPGWPAPPATYGSGLAVMKDGKPPFVRTNLFFPSGDSFSEFGTIVLSPSLDYIYFFRTDHTNADTQFLGGDHKIYLARTTVEAFVSLDQNNFKSHYQYWTQNGWSSTKLNTVYFFNNSNPPSVKFNKYLNKWISLSNDIFSDFGLLSNVKMRTADNLTGPWSEPVLVHGEKYISELQPNALFGTQYNPEYLQVFDKNNGRTFYLSSTDGAKYNVRLFEANFGYGQIKFLPNSEKDIFIEEKGKTPVAPTSTHPANLEKLGGTTVGLKLGGWNFFDKKSVRTSSLFLPFKAPANRAAAVMLKLQVSAPNVELKPGESFLSLEKIDIVSISYQIKKGDKGIYLGNVLSPVLSKAMGHSSWIDGNNNNIWLLVSRTDQNNVGAVALNYKDFALGIPTIEACQGKCPLSDSNRDGVIKVSCLGDSNTGTVEKTSGVKSWCDTLKLKGLSNGWVVTNYGVAGTSATEHGLARLKQSLSLEHPDLVILAYGTNDIGLYGHDAQTTVNSYKKLVSDASKGQAISLVTLSPPQICWDFTGASQDPIEPLNALLKTTFSDEELLDFYSIMDPTTDYKDCIHMNNQGQLKRANLAYSTLIQ